MITEITLFQSRQTLRFILLLSVVLLAATLVNAESMLTTVYMAAAILAIALTRGLLAGDIRDQRWPLLFQLPGHPVPHYARMLGITILMGLVPLLAVSATAVALGPEGQRQLLFGMAAGAMVFFLVLCIAAYGISTLVRQAETELTLLYLGASLGQDALFDALRFPSGLRDAVSMILFPINAIWTYARSWAGLDVEIAAHYLPQLILYPAILLAISAYRLNVLNRGD